MSASGMKSAEGRVMIVPDAHQDRLFSVQSIMGSLSGIKSMFSKRIIDKHQQGAL